MTTAAAPATVVLVHGAWHGPWCFNKVVAGLEERGVPVVNVERRRLHEPSGELRGVTNSDENEQIVRAALAEVEGPVVLLGHSFGGVAITTAPLGNRNVKHLVYLTAIMPDTDGGIPDNFANPELVGAMQVAEDGSTTVQEDMIRPIFYGECSDEDVADAMPQLVRDEAPIPLRRRARHRVAPDHHHLRRLHRRQRLVRRRPARARQARRPDRRVAHRPLPLLQQPKPRHRSSWTPWPANTLSDRGR